MVAAVSLPASIRQLRRSLCSGQISVAQSLQAQSKVLEAKDVSLYGVIERFRVDALKATDPLLPLSGIGLIHKDIFELAGRAPLCGFLPMDEAPPLESADVIQQLEQAGAVQLGIAAMSEFACGATGENPHYPHVVNPIDPLAVVGGSSSGSAAVVASGLCYGALGTDTFGSVRIPAATCGIFGFKPSQQCLSQKGVRPLAPSLDAVGLLTRTPEDAAILFNVLCPPSRANQRALTEPIHVAFHLPGGNASNEVAACATAFKHFLEGLFVVKQTQPKCASARLDTYAQVLFHKEASVTHRLQLTERFNRLTPTTKSIVLPGFVLPDAWYEQAIDARAHYRDTLTD